MIVGLYLLYSGHQRSDAPIRQRVPYRFDPVSPIDTNYAEKTLIEIRKYLTYHYQPAHSWAHIPRDIETYSTDTRLIAIIKQLERAEYGKQEIPIDEKEFISRELETKLKT